MKPFIIRTQEDGDFLATEEHPELGIRGINPLTGAAQWFELSKEGPQPARDLPMTLADARPKRGKR